MTSISDAAIAGVYRAVSDFANEAKRTILVASDDGAASCMPPSDEALQRLLPEGHRFRSILRAESATLGHIPVIRFDVSGKKPVGIQTCFLLPVHFAIVRALEIVPDVELFMHNETKRLDPVYRLNFRIPERPRLGLKGIQQGVGRLLFHVPSDAGLYELRGTDHHYIVPSNHALTKRRPVKDPPGQAAVLDSIRQLIEAAKPGTLPFTADEMMKLLTDLLTISDEWHWDMPGRKPDDERRSFGSRDDA